MASIRLHGNRLSPFVEKVYRGLRLKKLPFELVEPVTPFDLRRHNPQTAKMPALELEGEPLWDSTFILRRIDERFPNPPLLARDPRVAAAQRQLEDWSDESLYWYGMALRWCRRNARSTTEQVVMSMGPAFLRPVARLLLPMTIGRTTRAQGLGRLPHDVLVREYARLLDDLVWLLDDRAFFYADRCGLADLAIHGQLRTARSGPTPELEALVYERPALVDHLKRVEETCT
jgi:glutathione S-transferase